MSGPSRRAAPSGTIERRGGRVYAKLTLPDGRRKLVRVPDQYTYSDERAREFAAACSERVWSGALVFDPPKRSTVSRGAETTVAELVEAWCSGDLLAAHGPVNGLRALASDEINRWTLEKHAMGVRVRGPKGPTFGELRVTDVTEADVARVMALHDRAVSTSTVVKTWIRLHRVFELAAFPCGLRRDGDNPVTRRLRPTARGERLFCYLYPDEVLALLRGHEDEAKRAPVGRRVLYALAVYTGLRKGSLFALRWNDVDLENGTIAALKTKTGAPLLFAADPSLVRLLAAWRAHRGAPGPDEPVVRVDDVDCDPKRLATALREDLRAAGIGRAILFSDAPNVEPLRFHDLRATFCTWARRKGLPDSWISARTGHQTVEMVERYARAASTLADLQIEPFPPLDGTVPELAQLSPSLSPSAEGGAGAGVRGRPENRKAPQAYRPAEPVGASGFEPPTPRPPVQGSTSDAGQSGVAHALADAPNRATARPVTRDGDAEPDAVEVALADALTRASVAGEWEVVGQLSRELEARRRARAGVIDLTAARAAKEGRE